MCACLAATLAVADAPPFALPDGCARAVRIYSNQLAGADAATAGREWRMEGGGRAEWRPDALRLVPTHFTDLTSNVGAYHQVFWLDRDLPADVAVEWDFRIPATNVCPNGLAIVFFCARGRKGEDIFDSGLAPRDGTFKQYHSGDIDCYHISYFAGARGTANLRKNFGFHLIQERADRVAAAPRETWRHIRLIRFGPRIQMAVDDLPCIDWVDNGTIGGPPLGGGKLGFRQMSHLLWGEYANLRIYRLERANRP
jgi:hypothetical protein